MSQARFWKRLGVTALAQAAEDDIVLVDPERRPLRDFVDHVLKVIVANASTRPRSPQTRW
jgi:hypothetical protein